MKVGTIVRNEQASDDNPYKILIYMGHGEYMPRDFSRKIKFPKDAILTPIGCQNFFEWDKLIEAAKNGN